MAKKFVVCEINENYLEKVKQQMKKQKIPMPKDDIYLTVAHNPVGTISGKNRCNCKDCNCACKNLLIP